MSEDIKNNPYFMFENDTDEGSGELPYEDDFLSGDYSDNSTFDDLVPDLLDRAENLARFIPDSTDILGDCISYNMEEENFARAKYYYERLIKIDIALYGTKAFMAVIKYEMTDPIRNEASLRKYMSAFRDKFQKDEEPYVRQALLMQCLGKDDEAYKALTEAIENATNPENAYTMLAKIQLDKKEYEICRATVTRALSSTIRDESKLAALLSLYLVMSYESELEDRLANGGSISLNDFDKVIDDYEEILKDFAVCRNIYEEKINERLGLLRFWRKRYDN